MITKSQRDAIHNADKNTLAKWSCILNTWGWPEELLPEYHGVNEIRTFLRNLIVKIIGEKYELYYWNCIFRKNPMTEDEFETFWRSEFECDSEARKKYYDKMGVNL